MITFTKSYKTPDGQVHATLEEAQKHELEAVFNCFDKAIDIAKTIIENKDLIVDILTTTPNSKPKARSVNGGRKNRKPTVITDAAVSIGSTSNATQPAATAATVA